jgi:hypothetical protein
LATIEKIRGGWNVPVPSKNQNSTERNGIETER